MSYVTWHMCRRKKVYKTYRHALHDYNILVHNKGEDVHIYECPLCGKYHIGHSK